MMLSREILENHAALGVKEIFGVHRLKIFIKAADADAWDLGRG